MKYEFRYDSNDNLIKVIESDSIPQNIIDKHEAKGISIYQVVQSGTPEYNSNTQSIYKIHNLDKNNNLSNYGWGISGLSSQAIARNQYNAALTSGYAVSPEGYTLGLQESDRNNFTAFLTLLNEAQLPTGAEVSIKDIHGSGHAISVGRLKQVLVSYGLYYKTLFDTIS